MVAENKPVCSFPCCYAQRKIDADTAETYENEDSFGSVFQAIDPLVVFILCGLGVHGEDGRRTIAEVGLSLRWLLVVGPSPALTRAGCRDDWLKTLVSIS
jgi:hypothetical protein